MLLFKYQKNWLHLLRSSDGVGDFKDYKYYRLVGDSILSEIIINSSAVSVNCSLIILPLTGPPSIDIVALSTSKHRVMYLTTCKQFFLGYMSLFKQKIGQLRNQIVKIIYRDHRLQSFLTFPGSWGSRSMDQNSIKSTFGISLLT